MTTQRTSWALAREAAGLFLAAFGLLGVLVALGALHWAAGLSENTRKLFRIHNPKAGRALFTVVLGGGAAWFLLHVPHRDDVNAEESPFNPEVERASEATLRTSYRRRLVPQVFSSITRITIMTVTSASTVGASTSVDGG